MIDTTIIIGWECSDRQRKPSPGNTDNSAHGQSRAARFKDSPPPKKHSQMCFPFTTLRQEPVLSNICRRYSSKKAIHCSQQQARYLTHPSPKPNASFVRRFKRTTEKKRKQDMRNANSGFHNNGEARKQNRNHQTWRVSW